MNDGDKALVVQDELFIKVAERNMEGIVPLFYEMGVAKAETITNTKIYDSLVLAFKANIGEVSNNITKVFNSDNIDLRVVKWLTAENNYIIDYAKTLFMPQRPQWVDKIVKEYIKSKVPFFFIEAKDKDIDNVEPLNGSTVNKLRKIIPNKRIKFEEIAGKLNHKMLVSSEIRAVDDNIVKHFKSLEKEKRRLIRLKSNKGKREGKFYVDKYIRDEMKKIHEDENRIVNVLVEYLYEENTNRNKTTLWDCYGDILVANLRENLKGTKQCESCGERIVLTSNKTQFCDTCFEKRRKEYIREKVREYRRKSVNK